MTEETYDETPAERQQRLEADQINELALKKENDTIKAYQMFDTDQGQKILKDLEEISGYTYPSYKIGSGKDGLIDAAHFDGMKNVVRYIHMRKEQGFKELEKPSTVES